MERQSAEAEYLREYLAAIDELDGDEAGRRAAWQRMVRGTSYWAGNPTAFSYVPKLYSAQTRERFRHAAELTYGILAKAIEGFRSNEAFRNEFRLDPRVRELALLPRGCAEPLPFARVDFAYNEETGAVRAIEFNTDSSSGMNENREALRALRETQPFERFAARRRLSDDVEHQFAGWVERFKQLYLSSAGAKEPPRMAIVACLDSPDPDIGELETYRTLFEQAGMPCSVFDVRQLEFAEGRLVGRKALAGENDVTIDCIWRFCIVVDLLEHWDEVQPFLDAVRAGAVELIGSFATQIAHDKQLFAVLHRPQAQELLGLTPEERAFVRDSIPFTAFLDDPSLDAAAIGREPSRWVVKPTDWYESIDVVAGRDCTQPEWERTLEECMVRTRAGGSPFIVQEFCTPWESTVIPLRGGEGDFTAAPTRYGEVVGLYVQAGEFAGAYVRQGPHSVIGSNREGLVAPVVWVG